MNRIKIVLSFVCLLLAASCEDGPKGPQDVANEINAMLLTGQIVQAEELCKEAIRRDPSNPTLRTLYGEINLAAENGGNAEIDFRKAIALGADAAKMQTRLARALLLQKKYFKVLLSVSRLAINAPSYRKTNASIQNSFFFEHPNIGLSLLPIYRPAGPSSERKSVDP